MRAAPLDGSTQGSPSGMSSVEVAKLIPLLSSSKGWDEVSLVI